MTKLQLTEQLAVKLGITQSEAERFLNTFIHMIYNVLCAGDVVNISGFGKFEINHRKARIGVNPKNFTKLMLPAFNSPKFKAGSAFKDAVKLKPQYEPNNKTKQEVSATSLD